MYAMRPQIYGFLFTAFPEPLAETCSFLGILFPMLFTKKS